MKIHIWGTDFRRSSAEVRGQLYLPPEERSARIKELLNEGFQDLVYLSTCNRVEFYTTAHDYFQDSRPLWRRLLKKFGLSEEDFYRGYHLEGKSALRHLIRVASSLESLVIGEPQILGQLKEALQISKEAGVPMQRSLERSFQHAFQVAKRIRTETGISEKPVSVATLGMHRLEASEKETPLTKMVVVGRSPMCLTVLDWMKKNRPGIPVVWANRTVEKLYSYPESEGVELVALDSFLENPGQFSHLVTSTSSSTPIFDASFFARAEKTKKIVFDFAQPPDVELEGLPECHVELIHIEGLEAQAKENSKARHACVLLAEAIIDNSLREYLLEQKEAPILRDFNLVEPQFATELEAVVAMIETEFPKEWQPKMIALAEKLVKRNLHHSRQHLKTILRNVSNPQEEIHVV